MNNYLMTIDNVHSMMEKKFFSCEEFVKMTLDNIARLGCATGAYITLCRDEALQEARRVDKNGVTKPLSGIPIAVKDNICTKGVRTTAGSRILENFIPSYDATVIEKLRENGAIIIGKTNMDEFGMGSGCENSAYKSSANPVDFSYVPGGSSGGSAVAVKSSLAIAALGSDTGGSIRQPASFCGIYGLKPTYSLVSRYGLIAYASRLDAIGPMCSSVKDCAIMLNAICGFDKKDMTSANRPVTDYTDALKIDDKKLKIGLPKEFFEDCDDDVKKAVLNAAEEYRKMGHSVEECSLPALKYALGAYYTIASCEAASNLERYDGVRFGKRAENYENLDGMYIKTRTEGFGKEVKRRMVMGTFLSAENSLYYKEALTASKLISKDFDRLFEKYDVLLTPVSSKRVWKRGESGEALKTVSADKCTVAVSLAHLPAISVPVESDMNNMPVGMQLIGKAFDEKTILQAAYIYETGGKKGEI